MLHKHIKDYYDGNRITIIKKCSSSQIECIDTVHNQRLQYKGKVNGREGCYHK